MRVLFPHIICRILIHRIYQLRQLPETWGKGGERYLIRVVFWKYRKRWRNLRLQWGQTTGDWDFCKSMFWRNGFGWGKSGGLDGFLVELVRCCDGLCCGWDAGAYKKDWIFAAFCDQTIDPKNDNKRRSKGTVEQFSPIRRMQVSEIAIYRDSCGTFVGPWSRHMCHTNHDK